MVVPGGIRREFCRFVIVDAFIENLDNFPEDISEVCLDFGYGSESVFVCGLQAGQQPFDITSKVIHSTEKTSIKIKGNIRTEQSPLNNLKIEKIIYYYFTFPS